MFEFGVERRRVCLTRGDLCASEKEDVSALRQKYWPIGRRGS